ncbi:cytochrome P450 4d2 [Amyelois transitella]|uniref:cytochrome P450 4d2 n=1 Tax=Amyelois transitella TaxID=680683 RepID=UPI00067C6BD4|nr:cytochrome P450 4d2 [Amyelois transitella]
MWVQIVLGFILMVSFWCWRNIKFIKQYRRLGCSYTALPFIGHAHMFSGDREDIMNTFIKFAEDAIARGGVAPLWLLGDYHLCLADPLDCEAALKNYLSKDKLLRMIRLLTGDSFIFAPVEIWRPRRKLMAPLFSVRSINAFMSSFSKQSELMVDQLRTRADKEPFALWPYVNALTLDAACETVLGVDLHSQLDPESPILVAMDKLVELAGDGLTKFWFQVEFIMKNHHSYKRFLKQQTVIRAFIDEVIRKQKERSHTITMNPITKEIYSLEDETKSVSLIEKLISLDGGLKVGDAGIRDEALGLLLAATDTSATSISFVALMMARHPDVQEKVYNELQEVFGDSDRPVTLEDLPRLKYLEAVVKETLRLYPPASNIVREADKDFLLPSGVKVFKGSNLIISIWGVQRNTKYWGADADQFRPERFLEGPLQHQNAFLAFSCGQRGCTGVQFAMMFTKTAISCILRKYRVLPAKEGDERKHLRLLFSVTLKEIDNFTVRLQSRENKLV